MRLGLLFLSLGISLLVPGFALAFPDGSFHLPVTPECRPGNVFKSIDPFAPGASMVRQVRPAQSLVDHCNEQWSHQQDNSLVVLAAYYAKFRYPGPQPYRKDIKISLRDGRKVRGLLAVKPGGKARDLVIFRCGIFCNSDEGAMVSSTVMALFEQNPVNLLILGSATGDAYAEDNGIAHIGGFDEGYQNLQVASYVMDHQAQLGLKVRKIHVMGLSLGGLAALFSSYFYNVAPEFRSLPIGSFFAACPLVDPVAEFDDVLRNQRLPAMVFRYKLKKIFKQIFPFVKPLRDRAASGEDQFDLSLDISADYYNRGWNKMGFSRYIKKPSPLDRSGLLDATTILRYVGQLSPRTLVLHSSDDMIVPFNENSRKLLKDQGARLGVLRFNSGNHCAFGQSMSWGIYSELLTKVFGSQKDMPVSRLGLPPTLESQWPRSNPMNYQWFVKPASNYAQLKLWYYGGNHSIRVPLTELAYLGFPASGGDVSTASRMERYLNLNTKILSRSGADVEYDPGVPAVLEKRGNFNPNYGVY